ncbi:hypothetical protein GCM10011519_13740 [Marmoricola endophyticus]|uniref:MFS transporter n=2 Tax=Marmoricola endophyticus TaxID=2040280 RepID=A0A917BFT5_9ACTN|nr:hypothetical protein GCM10011519_13740 [Marmoricola endophyticus]
MARTWLALRGLSQAGDSIWTIALAWTAVHVASPAAAGAVVAAGTVPRALVLLLGGVVADRFDARRVMTAANLGRVVVLLAILVRVLVGPPSLTVLVLAAVVLGVFDALHDPSAMTVSRQLVRREDLPAYGAAGQTLSRLGETGGAATGGLVVAAWGLGASAALDAVTFAALAAFLLWRMKPRYPLRRAAAESPLRSIAGGVRHLRATPLTRTLVVSMAGLNLFVLPAESIGIALRASREGWGAGSVGLSLACMGAGAAAGALVSMRWRPRREAWWSYVWLAGQGVAIVALGVGPQWVMLFAASAIGVSAGVASVLLSATFVAVVEESYLGRMASIQRLGDDALMPLATVGFGALTGVAGLTTAFAVFGAAMTAAMALPLASPAIRRLSLREGPAGG